MYSTLKKEKSRRRRYLFRICLLIGLITVIAMFFIMTYILFIHLSEKRIIDVITKRLAITSIPKVEINSCVHYIFIDIGCYNGETIEHFLHFYPNAQSYNIYTFEPDPRNYQLCKQRLTQKKYSNVNITFLPQVAWIKNEKVLFQSNLGRYSRILTNKTIINQSSEELDAIDFSSWLARLVLSNQTKVHIKISAPGAEVPILEKMILDNTLGLADRYEVEWSDRYNPSIAPIRIYIQLMFDNRGFDCLYYTRLVDARRIVKINRTFKNVTKYYDWRSINGTDIYAHFRQRPEVLQRTREQIESEE